MSMPRVFISYSWEGEEHRAWVRKLATDLTNAGVTVRFDQWDLAPGANVTQYMEAEVIASDFVVAVCTPTFASKSEGRKGGVGYEQQIVSGKLLEGEPRTKFIPILRAGDAAGTDKALPTHFLGSFYLDFRNDASYAENLENLLRALFKVPRYARPNLGAPPAFLSVSDGTQISGLPVTIPLDQHRQINDVDAELAARSLIKLRRVGEKPKLEVTSDLQKARKEISSQGVTRERRLELERLIHSLELYDNHPDDIIKEAVETLAEHIYPQYGITGDLKVAGEVLANTVNVWITGLFRAPHKFDIIHENFYTSFGINLTTEERNSLAEKEGIEVQYLTVDWGLRLTHLDPSIVYQRVIPGMIREFFYQKYSTKTPREPTEFFNLSHWRVGLG